MAKKTDKKFHPDEIANSKRIYKSATPKYTIDWYIKWVASTFVLAGMSMRGLEGFQLYDLILSLTGISLWLWVSIIWNDRALIILNAAGIVLLARNLMISIWPV